MHQSPRSYWSAPRNECWPRWTWALGTRLRNRLYLFRSSFLQTQWRMRTCSHSLDLHTSLHLHKDLKHIHWYLSYYSKQMFLKISCNFYSLRPYSILNTCLMVHLLISQFSPVNPGLHSHRCVSSTKLTLHIMFLELQLQLFCREMSSLLVDNLERYKLIIIKVWPESLRSH